MNLKKILSIVTLITSCIVFKVNAQNVIVLQHQGQASTYSTLTTAFSAASDGDTLYLSGGTYAASNMTKAVHIIGAGYHPDSTQATLPTTINGVFRVMQEASGGSIEGCHFQSNFYFGTTTSNNAVNNFSIRRSLFQATTYFSITTGTGNATNLLISECVFIGILYGGSVTNSVLSNCIFYDRVIYFENGNIFSNNIFAGVILNVLSPSTTSSGASYQTGVVFLNNIFLTTYNGSCTGIVGCHFTNNIFTSATSYAGCGTSQSVNNIHNVSENNIFAGYTIDSPASAYFQQNFHLAAGSPAIGVGQNGIDCGIYSGTYPFKEGGVPSNPHIRFKNIAGETNVNGALPVQIKVAAQDN